MQPKLQQAFYTQNPVYIYVIRHRHLGIGLALRRPRRSDDLAPDRRIQRALGGVSQLNGKQVDVIAVEWGQAVKPEQLADALSHRRMTQWPA